LLTCLLPFLATEGSRVLEKKVNETQVSRTVLNQLLNVRVKVYFLVSRASFCIFQFLFLEKQTKKTNKPVRGPQL